MPLSEDEKRILAEIEEGLYRSDPSLSRDIAQGPKDVDSVRLIRLSISGLITGLVLIAITVGIPLISFVGFLMMFASALMLERALSKLNRNRINSLGSTFQFPIQKQVDEPQ